MAIDVRVRYTQMIIKKSFIELLKTKQITRITIKEICELAQINRSTFYKHYEDIYDLLRKITDELVEEFKLLTEQFQTLGAKQALVAYIEKIKQEKDMYLPLFSQNSDISIMRNCAIKCYTIMTTKSTNILEGIPAHKQAEIIGFLSWGGIGTLMTWFENGMKQSTAEIVDLITSVTIAAIKAAKE